MIRTLAAALLLLALAMTACGGDDDGEAISTPPARPSVTPRPPQTPDPDATPTVAELGYLAEDAFPNIDFANMLGMHAIPGDASSAVVLTQDGVIYEASLSDASEEPSVFLDIRDRMKKNFDSEEGLLGLAFAPDYETTAQFYINYTADNPRRNVISRFVSKGDAADPASETVLLEYEQPFENHNGGGMAFGPDGMLYIGVGDGGSAGDPQGNGQNTNTLLGKILRIDVSGGDGYSIPDDNPFAAGGGAPEVWAYGLRNPWRISFDEVTGELWAPDVGQDAAEEVNRIERGGNYGWNIMEGRQCFRADDCNQSGLILPRASYGHEDSSCSITGGYVYRGAAMPELAGWYIYGDFCSGLVWGLDTASTSEPVLLSSTERSIASFALDAEGEIYLVTYNNAIYRLTRAP